MADPMVKIPRASEAAEALLERFETRQVELGLAAYGKVTEARNLRYIVGFFDGSIVQKIIFKLPVVLIIHIDIHCLCFFFGWFLEDLKLSLL